MWGGITWTKERFQQDVEFFNDHINPIACLFRQSQSRNRENVTFSIPFKQ